MGSESAAVGALSAGGCLGVLPAPPSPQPLQDEGVATVWHRVPIGVAQKLGFSQETMALSTSKHFGAFVCLPGL